MKFNNEDWFFVSLLSVLMLLFCFCVIWVVVEGQVKHPPLKIITTAKDTLIPPSLPIFPFEKERGYGDMEDSTHFYYYILYTGGMVDSSFYKCNAKERWLAREKIDYEKTFIYLNEDAIKYYNEKLIGLEVQIWRRSLGKK